MQKNIRSEKTEVTNGGHLWRRWAVRVPLLLGPVFSLLMATSVCAQVTTTVADTLRNGNGQLLSGTITVSPSGTFTAADGTVVVANSFITVTVTNGAFSVALIPNAGATPSGTYYVAEYHLPNYNTREIWVIPATGPVDLADIRSAAPPQPPMNLAISQLNPPSPCTTNYYLQWTGTLWDCGPGSSGSGSGTVTSVGLALPSIFSVSGSPVTTSGTLTGALANENANLVFAGPSSGSAAAPTFRALVGADLPDPTATTLGGIESLASTSHEWINAISTSGVPSATQPACGDLSNAAASCSTDTTNASNISSGTLGAARLPDPTASTLGGIESLASTSHEWINAISTAGVPSATQPAFTDISGSLASGQLPSGWNPVTIANGGTGQTSANAAFNALSPMTTLGDIEYENSTPAAARLAGNTTSTLNVLTQAGTGSVSAAPAWNSLSAISVPTQTGTITTGDCVEWASGTAIQDAGAPCGGPTILQLTSDSSPVTGPTLTPVTGMSFTAAANTSYVVSCSVRAVTSASTWQYAWSGPSSPTALFYGAGNNASVQTAFGAASAAQSSGNVFMLTMGLVNGSNSGTVQLEIENTTSGDTATLKAGSWCVVQ